MLTVRCSSTAIVNDVGCSATHWLASATLPRACLRQILHAPQLGRTLLGVLLLAARGRSRSGRCGASITRRRRTTMTLARLALAAARRSASERSSSNGNLVP
jgi:hypothetical protein